jgi:tetratricopeptide (TPR) repeat protein
MMNAKKIFAAVLVGVFSFQSTAIAQNKPSLIVSPLRGKNTKAAMDAIGSEFKKSGQVFVVDFEKILEYVKSKQTKKTKKSTKDAVAAFEKGKKAYQNLNIKEAIEALEKSKMLYQDALWDESSFQGLRTTKFYLAMAYQADKKDTQAKLELQEVILIDPSRSESTLSEKYYSPQIRQLYQKVLKEVKTAEPGQVQITTSPAGATVFMDGASVGKTPLDLRTIPSGRHYFRLVSGEQEEFLEKFIVAGNNEVEHTFSQIETTDTDAYFQTLGEKKELDQPRATYLDEMGLALGADLFVFLTPLSGKVKGQLYDQRSQELSREITQSNPQALVAELLRSLGPDGYVVPSEHTPTAAPMAQPDMMQDPMDDDPSGVGVDLKPRSKLSRPNVDNSPGIPFNEQPQQQVSPVDNRQWHEKPWVWGAIAGGALAAALGLYFGGVIYFDSNSSKVTAVIP